MKDHESKNALMMVRDFLLCEMALLGQAQQKEKGKKWEVSLDSNQTRLGEPYFKFYNAFTYRKATKVARISFLEPRYVIHRGYPFHFKLDAVQKQALMKFLTAPAKGLFPDSFTNWQAALVTYNVQNIDYQFRQWYDFDANELRKARGRMRFALPIDLPMPNYLLLR